MIQKKIRIIKYFISSYIIISMLFNVILPIKSNAATYTQTVKTGISNFPKSYQNALYELQELHPNWTFSAYYTGIDWNEFIKAEGACGKNRVGKSFDTAHRCSCGNLESGYYCADDKITAYFIDPRNFLTERNIFQFLEISYNSSLHTKKIIEGLIKNHAVFNYGNPITLTITATGERKTMTYADIIMEAAKQSKMSPISIVIKIIQEVGTGGSGSTYGTHTKYPNCYNFFNIGSNDEGDAISNGLKYASEHHWNDQYTSIVEGAIYNSKNYIQKGQNTSYFYKYDCVGTSILTSGKSQTISSSNLYHQYMTNVQDPYSQSSNLFSTYTNYGLLGSNLNFIIPVYENMPVFTDKPSSLTSADGSLYYANVTSSVAARSTPSASASKVVTLYRHDKVAMIQKSYTTAGGYVWDKVKVWNGQEAYVASQNLVAYITPNTNIAVTGISLDKQNISLQVGNGAYATTSSLTATITPSNATNKNITWSSSNPNVATVTDGIITAVGEGATTITVTTKDGNKKASCTVTVTNVENTTLQSAYVNTDVLRVRAEPNTTSNTIARVYQDEQIIILQKDYLNDGTYIWYKIQTINGDVGYLASNYLTFITKVKADETNLSITTTPDVISSNIALELGYTNYEVLDSSGNKIANNSLVGTGYKFKNKDTGKEYIVIKKADINGDSIINSGDLLKIVKHLKGTSTLTSNEFITSADITNDTIINSGDLQKIVKYLKGTTSITLN